ncbi:MAG TPA: phytase, partial [Roseiflexaceae bacterium]|nr:phytase [Roseiflexaceae bacterium]
SLIRGLPRHAAARTLLALMFSISLIACGAPDTAAPSPPSAPVRPAAPLPVAATVETAQVPNDGDAADDPAIWVHPGNPALSTVIGTDKKGWLAVYSLDGTQIQYLPDGKMNNVDIRAGFQLGGQSIALVAASNRNNSIALYRVNPSTRRLENVAARAITTGAGYGACMYHSATTGKFYYFVNSEQGEVEQWELFATSAAKVDATKVRAFDVGSQTEGCVADDQLGYFYIGEEAKGIWKYGAEPSAGEARTQVDTTGSGGHLAADVEGLTIYDAGGGRGYLIASSQGDNTFVLYRREGANAYVTTFEIVAAGHVDGVSQTDGIDVTSANLGPAFPQGMFIAQDGKNDECNQNFKFVRWQSIAATIGRAPPDSPAPIKAENLTTSASQRHISTSATQNSSFLPIVVISCK